jgi:hypothetical protein
MSCIAVHKILKKHKILPYQPLYYKFYVVDADFRLLLLNVSCLVGGRIRQILFIINSILWTDESKFTYNNVINKQNNHYWYDQNLKTSK